MPKSLRATCVAIFLMASSWTASAAPPLARLRVPPGFHVALYSDQVPNARGIALGDHGSVFVGSMRAGNVYALTGLDNGRAEHVYLIAKDLDRPVGVAFHDGAQPFLTGFLDDQKTLGRPVDVQPLRDGSLLVSDDRNGVIYRVTYGGSK